MKTLLQARSDKCKYAKINDDVIWCLLSLYGTGERVVQTWYGVDCECEDCQNAAEGNYNDLESWMEKNGF